MPLSDVLRLNHAGPVGLWDSGAFLRFVPSLDALLESLIGAPPWDVRVTNDAEDDDLADDGD